MKSYQQFFAELKRRRVFRVAGLYGIVAFGVLQAADLMLPRLGLPDWTVTFMVALVVLAFPVVLIMAWAFEVTPEGVKRTDDAAPGEIEGILAAPASQRWPAGLLALVGVVLLVGSTWWIARRTAPEATTEDVASDVRFALTDTADDDRPSLAVLPFVNMSADEEQEYFSDGMTDEILATLARVRDLKVAARTSAYAFKGQTIDMRTVGDSLGVRYLIEGSVRKAGDELRITAQLIDAADGTHLWSDTYDRTLDDVFAIQSEIAEAIAAELRVPLGLDDPDDLVSPTADLEAYDLFLAGRARLRERGSSILEAIRLFEAAVARDSTWAPAWAGLAEAWEILAWYPEEWEGGTPTSFKAGAEQFFAYMEPAEEAARRALELDSEIPGAHVALGSIHRNRNEWQAAERSYVRALQLDPDNAEAYQQYSQLLTSMGRSREAIAVARRAVELDQLPIRLMMHGAALAVGGQFDEAFRVLDEGMALDSEGRVALPTIKLFAVLGSGQFEKLREIPGGPPPEVAEPLTQALIEGRFDDAPPALFGQFYPILTAHAGNYDVAAVELHDFVLDAPANTTPMIWFPVFDPVREHTKYLELLVKLNLEGVTPDRPVP